MKQIWKFLPKEVEIAFILWYNKCIWKLIKRRNCHEKENGSWKELCRYINNFVSHYHNGEVLDPCYGQFYRSKVNG